MPTIFCLKADDEKMLNSCVLPSGYITLPSNKELQGFPIGFPKEDEDEDVTSLGVIVLMLLMAYTKLNFCIMLTRSQIWRGSIHLNQTGQYFDQNLFFIV